MDEVGKPAREGWPERLRLALKRRGGDIQFLLPEEKKFPVKTGDCMSYRAAYARARQYGYTEVAKKALERAKRLGCAWAIRHKEER